jgi:hypothetical protein
LEDGPVPDDRFKERLAVVRKRFAMSLEGKITDTCAALPKLAGTGADADDVVAESYRRIHGICGVGPAVGFVATGRAARDVEDVLITPFRAKRGLTPHELGHLEVRLAALLAAARQELSC